LRTSVNYVPQQGYVDVVTGVPYAEHLKHRGRRMPDDAYFERRAALRRIVAGK